MQEARLLPRENIFCNAQTWSVDLCKTTIFYHVSKVIDPALLAELRLLSFPKRLRMGNDHSEGVLDTFVYRDVCHIFDLKFRPEAIFLGLEFCL